METKVCVKCRKEMDLINFHKDKYKKDGYRTVCKECVKKIHKEHKIYTKKCIYCGKNFNTNSTTQKYCSQKCKSEHQRITLKGENNPKYSSKKVKCEYCGKELLRSKYKRQNTNHIFCSQECKSKYQGGSVITECTICGKEIKVANHKIKNNNNCFCSKKCLAEWQSLNMSGNNSPLWNPEITENERIEKRHYNEYINWRKDVYERDNYTCQCCGSNKSGTLVSHHLNGYHWDKEHRTDMNNGITLCDKCHTEFHRIYGNKNNTREQFEDFISNQEL